MAKPKSSNRSIRLTDEMWAWLAAEADRRQTSVNGLVGDFLMVARLKAEERAVAELPNLLMTKPIKRRSSPEKAVERAPKPASKFVPRQDTYPDWMRKK
jgi:hypothetical protein